MPLATSGMDARKYLLALQRMIVDEDGFKASSNWCLWSFGKATFDAFS